MIYAAYLLAGLSILWRIRAKRFSRAEGFLLAALVVHDGLIAAEQLIGDGFFAYMPRYYYPTLIVYLLWVAALVVEAARRYPRTMIAIGSVFVAAVAAKDVWHIAGAHFGKAKRARVYALNAWATEEIRRDWKGTNDSEFVCHRYDYHPTHRPIIAGDRVVRSVYAVDGRILWPQFRDLKEIPDYYLNEAAELPPKGCRELLGETRFGKKTYRLYKRGEGK